MNDNVKLLNFIYQNSQMGVETIEQLEKIVEDKDFKRYLKEKYEVEYGTKIDSKQFSATDLSKTEITLDDSKVNYKKSGTYKATVIAKDSSNNETKKDIR